MSESLITFLQSGFIFGAMLALTAMGGYLSERSGIVDIGLEGKILAAACAAAFFGSRMGAVAGLVAAIVVATLMAVFHWVATQRYRIDHVISGMGLNLLATGGTLYALDAVEGQFGSFGKLPIELYLGLAILSPLALTYMAKRMRGGLRLTAVGADPDKARLMGIRPSRVRFFALLGTGLFCGLGGALILTFSGTFSDGMTAGRGYIALAALIVGGWRPIPAALASLGFGLLSALGFAMQGVTVRGVEIPSEFWTVVPYLVTLIAVAGFFGTRRPPAGIGKP